VARRIACFIATLRNEFRKSLNIHFATCLNLLNPQTGLALTMQPNDTNLNAQRPTRAEINLDNLAHNFRVMKEAVGSSVIIIAAVKSDAYGTIV
jgi:hypothetical protein